MSVRISGFHLVWVRPRVQPARGNILFSPAAGLACRTYQSFFDEWADQAQVNIFSYDVRGTGESRLPVAPTYAQGKQGVGVLLAEDLRSLYWSLRDYVQEESTEDAALPWVLCGHSLGAWLSIHAAVYAHVRKLILIDPPIFSVPEAARWAIACGVGHREWHPLSVMTRRRKRIFRTAEQAAWVFSKFEFFRGWPKERLMDYVNSNYRMQKQGLTLRHNPRWEADIVESQPSSATLRLLRLPKDARNSMRVECVFGAQSPFCSPASQLLVRTAFRHSNFHEVPRSGHMLVFQKQKELVERLSRHVLTPTFLKPGPLQVNGENCEETETEREEMISDLPQGSEPPRKTGSN